MISSAKRFRPSCRVYLVPLIVYQAKCIQWGEKDYELLVNVDQEKLDIDEVLAAYRHYLGEDAEIKVTYVDEIPIQASGKFMVCENKWDGRK